MNGIDDQLSKLQLASKRSADDNSKVDKSRREFVKQSGLTLAGVMAGMAGSSGIGRPASAAMGRAAATGEKVRIGVAGGLFGATFQWHEHPDCVVEAVTDLRPERRAALMKTYSCSKSYNSLEEMVKDPKIDAVAVFTDGPLHVQHTIEAMKHGKHVISAVPAAWGTLEQAYALLDIVEKTGLTYMMAETSYYQQFTISARKFYEEGRFGNIYHIESFYQHDGLEKLFINSDGSRSWRYGLVPMHYPTHCTGHICGVTGERLTEVSCHGWGDDSPVLKDNAYDNPFWNETAIFKTDRGNSCYVKVWWKGAHMANETAEWIGDKMSFYGPQRTYGSKPRMVKRTEEKAEDDAGFVISATAAEEYEQVKWYETDALPEQLRHNSGHEGSHCFITHEFIDALRDSRRPAVDVYDALNYTVPGIIAHESALRDGETMKVPQFIRPTGS